MGTGKWCCCSLVAPVGHGHGIDVLVGGGHVCGHCKNGCPKRYIGMTVKKSGHRVVRGEGRQKRQKVRR